MPRNNRWFDGDLVPMTVIAVLAVLAGVYAWDKSGDVIVTLLVPCGASAVGIVIMAIMRNVMMDVRKT